MSMPPNPETFRDGSTWMVDMVRDNPRTGRSLHFIFPDGRAHWIMIANEPDTPELREALATELSARRRHIKGELITPPPWSDA